MSDPRYVTAEQLEQFRDQERLNTEKMIKDALALENQQQEKRWHDMEGRLLKNVKSAITLTMDPYVRDQQSAIIRQNLIESTLFGDKARDGLLDTINQLKGEVSAQMRDVKEMLEGLSGTIDRHDDRLDHLEGIEKAAVLVIRFVGGAIQKFVTARVIRLLPLFIGIGLAMLASASFYFRFLLGVYQ